MIEENEDNKGTDAPADDKGDGVQSEAKNDLDRADEIVERRNRVCEREEAILDRKESFAARQAVGGGSEAGKPAEVKKEISDVDYSKQVLEGKIGDDKENN